jgi:hypothetical protein
MHQRMTPHIHAQFLSQLVMLVDRLFLGCRSQRFPMQFWRYGSCDITPVNCLGLKTASNCHNVRSHDRLLLTERGDTYYRAAACAELAYADSARNYARTNDHNRDVASLFVVCPAPSIPMLYAVSLTIRVAVGYAAENVEISLQVNQFMESQTVLASARHLQQ